MNKSLSKLCGAGLAAFTIVFAGCSHKIETITEIIGPGIDFGQQIIKEKPDTVGAQWKYGVIAYVSEELRDTVIPVDYDLIEIENNLVQSPKVNLYKCTSENKLTYCNSKGEIIADSCGECVGQNSACRYASNRIVFPKGETSDFYYPEKENQDEFIIRNCNEVMDAHKGYLVKKNGKWGYLERESGNMVIPAEYDELYFIRRAPQSNVEIMLDGKDNNYRPENFYALKDGKWHFFDGDGNGSKQIFWLSPAKLKRFLAVNPFEEEERRVSVYDAEHYVRLHNGRMTPMMYGIDGAGITKVSSNGRDFYMDL